MSMAISSDCILIFVKVPGTSPVKSRLARTVGETHATALYRCFVADWLDRLRQLPADRLVFYAPAGADVAAWLGPEERYYPQSEGDLGQRMAAAFQIAFRQGYRRSLVVGSDSPDLPLDILQEGFAALEWCHGVLGPTEDGGYYTLGFSVQHFTTVVFEQIAWSTSTVLETTLARFAGCDRTVHQLPLWSDIDTLEDLLTYYQRNHDQDHLRTVQYLQAHPDLLALMSLAALPGRP